MNLLVVERFVLRIGDLIICNSFDQIIVIGAVVLLRNVQRITIGTPTIFFFLSNDILVVLKQLAGLVFRGRMRLVLLILPLVSVLGPRLSSVWNNL